MKEKYKLSLITAVFLGVYFLPLDRLPFGGPVFESLALTRWYAREHVLLCLVPAFFIAGGISVFIHQASILKYFGAKADKALSYGVASVSGSILAVCSCTVLPLFSGIYKKGAGLGPAIAFLYSGPAINVLAIILTARVLGPELGLARAVGAVLFSIIIGLMMHFIFLKEENARHAGGDFQLEENTPSLPLWKSGLYFAVMTGILIILNWANPAGGEHGLAAFLYKHKWRLGAGLLLLLGGMTLRWFRRDERIAWVDASWGFAKQIMPLLVLGVLAAGFFFGRPGHEGIIPSWMVEKSVGGNGLAANLFASVIGALMYFATLTEVPIVQGLIGSGMGKGPALALLLAGPALSLPNMLVMRGVIGTKKTGVYVGLVVIMATLTGMMFGVMTR